MSIVIVNDQFWLIQPNKDELFLCIFEYDIITLDCDIKISV